MFCLLGSSGWTENDGHGLVQMAMQAQQELSRLKEQLLSQLLHMFLQVLRVVQPVVGSKRYLHTKCYIYIHTYMLYISESLTICDSVLVTCTRISAFLRV